MATIDEQLSIINSAVSSLNAAIAQILSEVQALGPAKPDDLAPVTAAIAQVQTTVSAIATKLPV